MRADARAAGISQPEPHGVINPSGHARTQLQGILTRRREKSKGHPHELHRLQVEELASKFQVNFSAIQGLFVAARLTAQPESRLSATPRTLSANTLTNFFAVGNCLNCDFHHLSRAVATAALRGANSRTSRRKAPTRRFCRFPSSPDTNASAVAATLAAGSSTSCESHCPGTSGRAAANGFCSPGRSSSTGAGGSPGA